MIDFHRRFERVIGVPKPLDSSLQLFSLRAENGVAGFGDQVFYDAVYSNEDTIVSVPCVIVDSGNVYLPVAARAQSREALLRVSSDVLEFAATHSLKAAGVRIIGDDPALSWIADPACGAALLGLSTYERFFKLLEPYEASLMRANRRRVLDLCAGLGDGALLLKSVASAVDAVTVDDRLRRIAQRMGRDFLLERPPAEDDYGLVLHANVDAGHVPSAVEMVRAKTRHGTGVVTAAGERGRNALEPFGTPRAVMRPGFESAGPTGDWEVVLGDTKTSPPIVHEDKPAHTSMSGAPLSVLMLLRPSARVSFGGDVVQVHRTAEALRRRGHNVIVSMDERPDPAGYDVVHVTNLTATMETLAQVRAVRSFEGPVALMPIFLDHADETIWGMALHAGCFIAALGDTQLEQYLERLAMRALTTQDRPAPPVRLDPFDSYTAYQREIVNSCDIMIANAFSEVHRIYRHLDCKVPFAIAPSATDASTYGPHMRKAFVDEYGIEDFVLCTGRIEARKNQLLLMHALRDSHLKLVLIGSNEAVQYGALVRAFRSKNTLIIPNLPEAQLAGAYAAARVLAMPSWNEVVSLSSLNGAASEASLVLSRNAYEHEYFRDDAEFCDPGDIKSIREAVERAWHLHEGRSHRRGLLAARVRAEYTWEHSAEATETAYRRVLASNPRGERRLGKAALSA